MPASLKKDETAARLPPEVSEEILRKVSSVQFGSVEVVIHNGRVVQIEVREKVRIGNT